MTYEKLQSYQQAKLIYDLTAEFCRLYINQKSRTYDQMIQAARSGKQNIVEGSSQSKQKAKSELYLLSIASASLKELLEDYRDFLRQQDLPQWGKDDPRSLAVRSLAYKSDKTDKSYKTYKTYKTDKSYKTYKTDKTYKTYKSYLNTAVTAANLMITLINQTTYLLDQQIRAVEKQMEKKGISTVTRDQKLRQALEQRKEKNEAFDRKLDDIIKGKRESL